MAKHPGKCEFVFDKYVGGKCAKCGFHKKGQYKCIYNGCTKKKTVKHFCVGR